MLPEASAGLSGSRPVKIEHGWDTVEQFVGELNEALSEEDKSIRETELDHSGGFKKVYLEFADEGLNSTEDVFVDRLGRLVVPPEQKYQELQKVTFISINGGDTSPRRVVNFESRYEGDIISAFVVYLESEEEDADELD